mmetsp:Transcript_17006/g.54542  ORF Transcript_17006/g.54542 Transcript_17006/m.54542 type:complete len:268 (-) Transcript_17006:424-1227(-)
MSALRQSSGGTESDEELTLADFAKKYSIPVRKDPDPRAVRRAAPSKRNSTTSVASASKRQRTSGTSHRAESGAKAVVTGAPWKLEGRTDKRDVIVNRVLIRWWHCMDWPNPSDVARVDEQRKRGYKALPGYPGVYVGIRVDLMGEYDIKELPSLEHNGVQYKPSHMGLSGLPISKLVVLWVQACANQLGPLREAVEANDSYGSDVVLERLRREHEYATNVLKKISDKHRTALIAALEQELDACRADAGKWNVSFLEQQLELAKTLRN